MHDSSILPTSHVMEHSTRSTCSVCVWCELAALQSRVKEPLEAAQDLTSAAQHMMDGMDRYGDAVRLMCVW